MLITPSMMPSNGIDPKSEAINIPKLNFLDVLNESKLIFNTSKQKFEYSLELIKSKISNWQKISLIDLDYVIFNIKKASVSDEATFVTYVVCPECGENNVFEININEINQPLNLIYDVEGTIEIAGAKYNYKIPMLDRFVEVYSNLNKMGYNNYPIEIYYLISCFVDFESSPNATISNVVEAVQSDISELFTFYSMYFNNKVELNRKCINCKGGNMSVNLRDLIDSVFHTILLNGNSTEIKIIPKQVFGD